MCTPRATYVNGSVPRVPVPRDVISALTTESKTMGDGTKRSNVLFWPCCSSKKSTHGGSNDGYILGWDDEHLSAINMATTICIPGVFPSSALTMADIQNALNDLSMRHRCHFHQINGAMGKVELKARKTCNCFSCICYGQLKIVARWSRITVSALPIIVPTEIGPWWQHKQQRTGQLIAYEPCGGMGKLGHYRCDRSGDVMTSFRRTLCRLSEAEAVHEELAQLLGSKSSGSSSDRRIDSSSDAQHERDVRSFTSATDTSHDVRPWGRFCSQLGSMSLTYVHLRKKRAATNSIFPLQCVVNSLISRSRMVEDALQRESPRDLSSRRFLSSHTSTSRAFISGIDWILGIIIGSTMLLRAPYISQLVSYSWILMHERNFEGYIKWLESFPIGFKLNVPLTTNMGRKILMALKYHRMVTSLVDERWQNLLVFLFSSIGPFFGAATMLAVLFDVIRCCTLHLVIISGVFQRIYSTELRLLSSLWLLFRGKKRNVLRMRSDSMEYDFMQLLVGMILFSVVVFLFTTILVYYLFFSFVNLMVTAWLSAVWLLYLSLDVFPVWQVGCRIFMPEVFPTGVYFTPINVEGPERAFDGFANARSTTVLPPKEKHLQRDVATFSLNSRTRSVFSLLSKAYAKHLKSFGHVVGNQIIAIVFGRPISVVSSLIENISTE